VASRAHAFLLAVESRRSLVLVWERLAESLVLSPAITPALGSNVAACVTAAVKAARAAGATVSVDLNYRRTLWSEAEAQKTMRPLMPDVDVLMANEEDIQAVLGLGVPKNVISCSNAKRMMR